ncbi:MAG: phage integrase N-terminal SAM-like domain-containing protein, partial [Cyclobacteriaceae bacterium]
MDQKTIHLSIREYHGQTVLMLQYPFDRLFISKAKALKARWSPPLHAWYLPWNDTLRIKSAADHFRPDFRINDREVPLSYRVQHELSAAHNSLIGTFTRYLQGSRYSPSTVTTYRNWIIEFLYFHRNKPSGALQIADVHRFNHDVIIARGYSASSQRQFIGALKLFFTHVYKDGPDPGELDRPRKDYRLPEVLNKQEIVSILSATKNLKHRTILSLLYSCGLRVGELIRLSPADLDFERMLVRVHMSKGRKDRYVRLGGAAHILLGQYLLKYRPAKYLFEGSGGGI